MSAQDRRVGPHEQRGEPRRVPALEASATANLLEIDNMMTSVFKELDQKLVFIND